MTRDWRDDRTAELETENAELRRLVAKLEERIRTLEARLDQNSSNSSQPPSKDTPEQRRNRKKKKESGRSRGGQPGHKPHRCALLPPEKVSQSKDYYPEECGRCGASLPAVAEPDAVRHQVIDLPRLAPEVTLHRLHAIDCDECGHRTRASLPLGVPRSMLGPRLLALVGLLTGDYRLSRRQASGLLQDVLDVRVSLGALSEAEERVSEAVAPAVDEAHEFALAQPVKHVDATSWSCRGLARALWTITTATVTVFAIVQDGSKTTLQRLLSHIQGVLVSDRAKVFHFWAMAQRQICWAHLSRKFASFVERGGAGSQIARQLHDSTELMFHYLHRVRDGTLSRQQFQQWLEPVRERVEWLLERGVALKSEALAERALTSSSTARLSGRSRTTPASNRPITELNVTYVLSSNGVRHPMDPRASAASATPNGS